MKNRSAGFTLVELMMVVAVLGALTTIAASAYASYVTTSKTAVVSTHYDDAQRFIRFRYAQAAAQVSQGTATNPVVPVDAAGWIDMISDDGSVAPNGGPTYVPGAGDPVTGAIGIQVSGTFSNGDSTVTITRPAYGDLSLGVVVVSMGS